MLRIFIGVDKRQWVSYHVLCSSIIRNSSKPVSITPVILDQCPIKRRGLTEFTFTRYLAPYFCDYKGKSLFIDSDILMLGDVSELFSHDFDGSVAVVPFDGNLTFERPSVMLFNNEKCLSLTPEYLDDESTAPQSFEWADSVNALPSDWNHLVGYSKASKTVKLVHYTQGIPGYKECRDCEYSSEWFDEHEVINGHHSWIEVMGDSVHLAPVLNNLKEKVETS